MHEVLPDLTMEWVQDDGRKVLVREARLSDLGPLRDLYIATYGDRYALPEVVDDGKTGYLVDAESPDQLAAAITRYFENDMEDTFRQAIAEQTERFDWNHEIALVEEFLGEPEC